MLQRLLIAGIVVTLARGATAPKPSEFYIASVFFSDNGALFYYRVIDVRQDGPTLLSAMPESPRAMSTVLGLSYKLRKPAYAARPPANWFRTPIRAP